MSTIVIAGGGIGGLATALAVTDAGHEAVVLERQSRFAELGAGIQLAPNAFRALDRLGVGAAVRERANFIDELRLMDAVSGEAIVRLPLGTAFRHRFGNPYAVVHRGDLYEHLLRACRARSAVRLRADATVVGYDADDVRVAVHLDSGESVTGDALVGADGLRSTVRAALVGDGPPRISGHTIYRSVIPIAEVPEDLRWNAATLWGGPDLHIVHYPINGWRSYNLAATVDDGAQEAVSGEPVDGDQVLAAFAGVVDSPRRLLERGRDWRRWVLCDRDPVTAWAQGRVVLLGDAAHPMLQYAAQGAAMALEDAVCLGEQLARPVDVAEAFARFAALRQDRTARVQVISRRLGDEVYHPRDDAARRRNAQLGALTEDDLYGMLDWLYCPDSSWVGARG
ncbi:3-hydroxybenzoate 6-monooxygenase [Planosporangium thailandense]|uniref:3-hydroxybenzoate 6-monooxygenase n=1 Tax=Planosporangium thailandense TaxID=765197 RepID=A0ABX0XXB7_9ACTN|nr:3-hydroxybenzoate 6-monooxygenase [Planosporangium thailandense]NJC70694.1 3-hydroxybenzoate 6-monooxygenase [Planosporangium thailandense]